MEFEERKNGDQVEIAANAINMHAEGSEKDGFTAEEGAAGLGSVPTEFALLNVSLTVESVHGAEIYTRGEL